jgi:ergothioneine biosynthesis protein EgtB
MEREQLLRAYAEVRGLTMALVEPLAAEDWRIQSMPDVSPPYWNLGHTSWFFARNVLPRSSSPLAKYDGFDFAFNSYYEGLGPRLDRARRGQVARPGTEETLRFRREVDDAMLHLLESVDDERLAQLAPIVRIGMQHEQQHQELLLTEILHIRWSMPEALRRPYLPEPPAAVDSAVAAEMVGVPVAGGLVEVGHLGEGFCWDNELPVHPRQVGDVVFAERLVTNAEWLAFLEDGAYDDPLLWLSNGWAAVQKESWRAPLYWQRSGSEWMRFTLHGLQPLQLSAPVCHVSFYEAEAFARWYAGQHRDWRRARLPFEAEWENAARRNGYEVADANLLDGPGSGRLDVVAAQSRAAGIDQLCGDVWEWTLSHYEPYPGYEPFDGALMEYNGKFMDNQRVLRGGSFATPRGHARVAYRNFWPATTRFQASGVRLCRTD